MKHKKYQCLICGEHLTEDETYEYRGAYACSEHLDAMRTRRDLQRAAVIREQDDRTQMFKGLDLSDSPIGRINREILAPQIERARQETPFIREYEREKK